MARLPNWTSPSWNVLQSRLGSSCCVIWTCAAQAAALGEFWKSIV
jgi:hypothetical protein